MLYATHLSLQGSYLHLQGVVPCLLRFKLRGYCSCLGSLRSQLVRQGPNGLAGVLSKVQQGFSLLRHTFQVPNGGVVRGSISVGTQRT